MQGDKSEKQGSSFYPFIILALLSLVAVFDRTSPLDSLRPAQSQKPKTTQNAKDRLFEADQRIWEDPFKNAWFHDAKALRGIKSKKETTETPATNHELDSLELLMPDSHLKQLIMPVIFPDSYLVRDVETRSRRRYAIHQALSTAGYRSKNSEYIVAKELDDGSRIAIEQFERDNLSQRWYSQDIPQVKGDLSLEPKQQDKGQRIDYFSAQDFSGKYDLITVAYLRSGDIDKGPFTKRLRAVCDALLEALCAPEQYAETSIRVIGPANSGQIFKLVNELNTADAANSTAKEVYILSPVATADYETLAGQLATDSERLYIPEWDQSKEDVLAKTHDARNTLYEKTSFKFIRNIHRDSLVLEAIIRELNTRKIINNVQELNHVALIVESDTRYGRAMTANFLKGAKEAFDKPRGKGMSQQDYVTLMQSLKVFPYISGLDGDQSFGTETAPSKEASAAASGAIYSEKKWSDPVAHGNHQIDYIRRLAEDIASKVESGDQPIRAIGILGSDVYDKLLLMRALEPIVGEVVFFTTDLDARLWHSSEIDFTRNMIVGSSHGLKLNDSLQRFVPPFRDSYQTSIFATVLLAANALESPYEIERYRPQVFEIGRTGPVYLSGGDYSPSKRKPSELTNRNASLFPDRMVANKYKIYFWWFVTIAASFAAILGTQLASRQFLGSSEYPRITYRYRNLIIGTAIVILIYTLFLLRIKHSELEPISLYEGISGWPAFYLNLFNSVLAISLCTYIGLSRNDAAKRALLRHTRLRTSTTQEPEQSKSWRRKNPALFNFMILLILTGIYGALLNKFGSSNSAMDQAVRNALAFLVVPMGLFLIYKFRSKLKQLHKNMKESKTVDLDDTLSRNIRTIYLPFFFFMLISIPWALVSGYNFLPFRSPILHSLFEFSQLLQICTMVTLLAFVVYESIWVTALVWGLSKSTPDRIYWDSENILKLTKDEITIKKAHANASGQSVTNEEKLIQIGARCVDFTSRITEIPNQYLIFPFIILMLSLLSQSTDFEDWDWTQLRWFIVFCLFGLCLLPAAILRLSAMKLRSKVIRQLDTIETSELFDKPVNTPPNKPEDFVKRLRSIKRGAYAPMLNQPAILAILTPMGGLGSLALIKLLFTSIM